MEGGVSWPKYGFVGTYVVRNMNEICSVNDCVEYRWSETVRHNSSAGHLASRDSAITKPLPAICIICGGCCHCCVSCTREMACGVLQVEELKGSAGIARQRLCVCVYHLGRPR